MLLRAARACNVRCSEAAHVHCRHRAPLGLSGDQPPVGNGDGRRAIGVVSGKVGGASGAGRRAADLFAAGLRRAAFFGAAFRTAVFAAFFGAAFLAFALRGAARFTADFFFEAFAAAFLAGPARRLTAFALAFALGLAFFVFDFFALDVFAMLVLPVSAPNSSVTHARR